MKGSGKEVSGCDCVLEKDFTEILYHAYMSWKLVLMTLLCQVPTAVMLTCIIDRKLKAQQGAPEPCVLYMQPSGKWLVLLPRMSQILC